MLPNLLMSNQACQFPTMGMSREEKILFYLPKADQIARKRFFNNPRLQLDDLIQEARMTVVKCMDSIDPERPETEGAFILRCVKFHVMNVGRKNWRIPEISMYDTVTPDSDVTVESFLPEPTDTSKEFCGVDRDILSEIMEMLPDRERSVMMKYYGIGGTESRNMNEIATEVGLSTMAISVMIRRMHRILHEMMNVGDAESRERIVSKIKHSVFTKKPGIPTRPLTHVIVNGADKKTYVLYNVIENTIEMESNDLPSVWNRVRDLKDTSCPDIRCKRESAKSIDDYSRNEQNAEVEILEIEKPSKKKGRPLTHVIANGGLHEYVLFRVEDRFIEGKFFILEDAWDRVRELKASSVPKIRCMRITKPYETLEIN